MNDISSILRRYKENMDKQRTLDEALFLDQEKADWIASLQKRATENQRMYTENGQLLLELEKKLEMPLDDEAATVLYEEAHSMYWDGYDDCQVLLPMLYKLEQYYEGVVSEQRECIEKLLFIYGAIYYEVNEVQNRREGRTDRDETNNYKILKWREDYRNIDKDGRRRIWGTYYNLIVSALGNGSISPETSYKFYKEALEFWDSPEVKVLDGKNEEIKGIVERIIKEWLIVEEYIEDCTPEVKEAFCRLALNVFEKEMREQGDIYKINSEAYAAYLHALVLRGEKSIEEIVDIYFAYYNEKIKLCPEPEEITDEDFYFIINAPLTIERWLQKATAEEKRKSIMDILKKMTQESWYQKLEKYASPFLNGIMAEWCFTMMKYMDEQDEKAECLFQLLVRRQLPTYFHSVMVANLAEALFKEIKRNNPELLEVLKEIEKEEQILYIRQCALLHDVGKTKITDIVNTQGRKLWAREFIGIKNHPEYGANMLDTDCDLKKYRDVALGHHKYYDGNGGYPVEFDNVNSPYRTVIDLITICDCIDAATDYLGRNYKSAKSLDQVLEELVEGKGTRYNPILVEIIENSPRLKKEMRYIVNEGRLDIMYRAYLERVY